MRRAAPALGLVFALLPATVAALPAPATAGTHVTTARSAGLDTRSKALGAAYVSVSWNWSRSDRAYRVQVSRLVDFSEMDVSRVVRSKASRPSGGRQATVVGRLHDATYYYVRVRRVGASKSSWSPTVRVATRAHIPDKITSSRAVPGANPGTTRITWSSTGHHTDYYKIVTATSPFGSKSRPAEGRNSMKFRAPASARALVLTPEQTQAAGAGLGTARHLFYRITAVRSGEAASTSRPYPFMKHATVAGQAPTTSGTAMRFAAYNVHVATKDVAGHRWADRAQRVANNIARQHPAITALAEMMPAMWTKDDGGPGLDVALQRAGAGQYTLTRKTPYGNGVSGDVRILYDPRLVQMTSTCDSSSFTCAIKIPGPGSFKVAAYARFKDLASGQEFWFVAVHFAHGNTSSSDDLRGRQAQAVADGMASVNSQHLPVIVAGDYNSSQTSPGHDQAHNALLDAGYYNTAAAVKQVHLTYNSVNSYRRQRPSPYGFGSLFDTVMTLGMPGAARFEQILTGSPWPSDHNLVLADLRLP